MRGIFSFCYSMSIWVLFVLFVLPNFARATDNIVVLIDAYNPPNMYIRDGKAAGLYANLIKAIAEQMGESVDIVAVPWKRALEGATMGTTGVGGVYKTPERLTVYDFSDEIYAEQLLVFVKRDRSFDFTQVDDLRGKKIGVILGWSYGTAFDTAQKNKVFTVSPVNRDELNFKKLEDGRLDCVVASRESGLYQISKGAYRNIYPLEEVLLTNPTYVAFSKDSEMKNFLSRFNEALRQMKSSGEYQDLVEQFYEEQLGLVLKKFIDLKSSSAALNMAENVD